MAVFSRVSHSVRYLLVNNCRCAAVIISVMIYCILGKDECQNLVTRSGSMCLV